jgi:membrane protease YdiL (CAAX protease family)
MPVGLGTGLVLLLWFLGWRRAPGERRRWGVVAVPLALAPLVGAGTSYVSCVGFGAFSLGVVLLGLVGQGTALLAFGALILWLLGSELDVIIGPRLSTGYASQLAVFYVFSVIARALMTLGALWTFFPNLRQGQDRAIGVLFESLDDPLGRGLMILAAVVLAPLAEEVIFRGVLLPGLARQMHPGTALWISAALFALFHVPSHGLGAVFPGLLGVVFGWARLRTGSLLAPIMLHAANNLLVTVLAWSQ